MGFNVQRNIGGEDTNITLQAMQQASTEDAAELRNEQQSSKEAFIDAQKEAVNPFARAQKKEKPVKAQMSRVQKMLQSGDSLGRMLPLEAMKNAADQFQRRNPELRANVLVLLREAIKPDDTKEEILRKLMEFYPDVSLADEALEFLLETTDGELARKIMEVKEELNQERGREITAGRNIHIQAREASEKGLGTPTSMRDMYRDITANPREATTLFEELSKKYAFKDLKKVTDFLLHSLGADMKSKGPSIEPGELHRLFTETRTLQAILGVYRFFRGRMNLMKTLFENSNIPMPDDLNFEKMAKEFMGLCAERYPSSDKVMQRATRLGLDKWIQAKIIALSQFRDGVREVAMAKIYKSLQHRDDLYLAILEALEDLEDELDKLAEEDEEEEGEGGEEEQEEQEEEQSEEGDNNG